MDFTSEEFRKKFPNLTRELEQDLMRVNIDSIRTDAKDDDASKKLRGYTPDVIDFLRRCDNDEEAEKVIDFLERRGEISSEFAVRVRAQLHEKGLRGFGSKKEHGHYFKVNV